MTLKRLLGVGGLTATLIAILFLSSGHLDWPMAWVYVGARTAIAAVSMFAIASKAPQLLEERFRPGEDAKAWDRPLVTVTMLFWPAIFVVIGLDRRFGWSSVPTLAIRLIALTVSLFGDALSKWAAASNRFYSRIVRIQRDREHTVITDGPYRYVRHPGYAGALVTALATPIALGSLWALVCSVLLGLPLVLRTALEDRTLHKELLGYAEYAQQTRYRLLPGIW
jgi:protein-S-isoprenylcysteine O-methyltransferase Ste14